MTRTPSGGPVPPAQRPHGRDATADGGASPVRHAEVSQGVSAASAARTRTMAGDTVEFKAVDYRPPQGVRVSSDTRPEAVAPVAGAALGKARGTKPLRGQGTGSSVAARAAGEPLPRRTVVLIAVALALVAAAVFTGGYFLARGVLGSVNDSASNAASAAYATDAYTLFVVEGDGGALAGVYLGYVDSINERVTLVCIPSDTYAREEDGDALGLDDVYARDGLEGLRSAIAGLSGVDVPTAQALSSEEMDQVLALATLEGDDLDTVALAASIWDEDQLISATALRGLLGTMNDIAPEDHVALSAPTDESDMGGETMPVLRDQEWRAMVAGMRDPSTDAALFL